jgi:hypothetical protein
VGRWKGNSTLGKIQIAFVFPNLNTTIKLHQQIIRFCSNSTVSCKFVLLLPKFSRNDLMHFINHQLMNTTLCNPSYNIACFSGIRVRIHLNMDLLYSFCFFLTCEIIPLMVLFNQSLNCYTLPIAMLRVHILLSSN